MREKVRKEADRIRSWRVIGNDRGSGMDGLLKINSASLLSWLRGGPSQRFYGSVSVEQRDKIRDYVFRHHPEWIDRAVRESDRLLQHELDLLGYTNLKPGPRIDWHRDPVTGYSWPRQYWADYDPVSSRSGDAKIIHELNRQQHLPRLAKVFLLTGEERYAREALSQIEDWIQQNPKWMGINWSSSLEIAIRSVSWMWTLFLLLPSKVIDEISAGHICKSLFDQLNHVYRYPSLYSSPNTHLIGEAAALFMGGMVFAEYPHAAAWRSFGATMLIEQMQRQVNEEGVYGELSSYYHCYAADFYLQAMLLAHRHRFAFPEWMWKTLSRMFEFISHMTRADGTIPFCGDDDGGRALCLAARDYRNFRDGLCTAAIQRGRSDFKYQAGEFAEDSMWLVGEDSWKIFESLDSHPPLSTHYFCPQAGYFIQRSAWAGNDSHLVFDCGGLGMAAGGHGHADALSIALFAGGTDLLVDPGTAVYNGAADWRNYFRSTRAHNTVVVDGLDQSEMAGTFSWKRKADARVLQDFTFPGISYISGEHDGYCRLRQPVTHRRRVVHIHSGYWIVIDEMRGTGEHEYEVFHHFASGARLLVFGEEAKGEVECQVRDGNSELQISLYASVPVQTDVACGQVGPIQGWSSEQYGKRRPAPVLCTGMRAAAPVGIVSLLRPGRFMATRRIHAGGSAIAVAARDADSEDIVVFSIEDAALQILDYKMRGEFFWLRNRKGVPTELLAVNALSFEIAGHAVLECEERRSHVRVHFWEGGMVIEQDGVEGKVYVRDLRDRQFQRG
jgi:hypothetical protein